MTAHDFSSFTLHHSGCTLNWSFAYFLWFGWISFLCNFSEFGDYCSRGAFQEAVCYFRLIYITFYLVHLLLGSCLDYAGFATDLYIDTIYTTAAGFAWLLRDCVMADS